MVEDIVDLVLRWAIPALCVGVTGWMARQRQSDKALRLGVQALLRDRLYWAHDHYIVRGELPIWVCVLIIGRDIYLGIGTLIVRHYHRRPIDVVFPGKIATALLMTGFSLMLLGFPVVGGLHLLPPTLAAFPGLNGSSVPLGIFFVYGGVIFSMLTAVIYSVKGGMAIKQAIAHPEDEDVDFLNPEIED